MKNKVRIISVVLALSMSFVFTACGGATGGGGSSTSITDADLTENPDYQSLLITYDDNYVPNENADTDMVTPYLNSEAVCSCYIWGAHVTSLYAYLEGSKRNADSLAAYGKSSMSWVDSQDYLEGAWGITDRDSAKEIIEKMITVGHQSRCRAYIQKDESTKLLMDAIKNNYGDSFSFDDINSIDKDFFKQSSVPTKDFYKVKAAACTGILFGENGLAGYDYMRMLRVVTFSADCWLLSIPEYLEYVYNLTCALQKQYSSYEEIHQCYYLGEMFRSAKEDDKESISDLEEIRDSIETMKSDGFYTEAEADFGMAIEKDWDDVLITRKELRER